MKYKAASTVRLSYGAGFVEIMHTIFSSQIILTFKTVKRYFMKVKGVFYERFIKLVPVLALFFFSVSPAFSENSSSQLMIYRLKEGKVKEISDHFSMDEKIYAKFTFLPEERETGVEFRWINPLNTKKQTYFELVKSPIPHEKITVLCWMLLQSRLYEKIIGPRFFGRWRLEIWVNSRRITEKAFYVGN